MTTHTKPLASTELRIRKSSRLRKIWAGVVIALLAVNLFFRVVDMGFFAEPVQIISFIGVLVSTQLLLDDEVYDHEPISGDDCEKLVGMMSSSSVVSAYILSVRKLGRELVNFELRGLLLAADEERALVQKQSLYGGACRNVRAVIPKADLS